MNTGFDRQLSRAHRPMGGVNAIRKINGLLMGGADPRRSSYAIAR
jgi:gamma-glutamyltranspeptidase/glutathione hydrolase